jgi:mTERF domain-containing protein, mitochondrial
MVVVSHLQAALSRIVRSRSRLPASPYATPLVFPHRLLPSSAASSSDSFSVKDYLVSRCGLTQAQALKAAARLSHLRSRAKPEAVLTYLESTLGVPAADVGRAVVIDPSFLCSNVERTLAPRVAELRGLGLSQDEIARLVPLAPNSFRSKFLRGNVEFWLAQFGSFDRLLHVLRWSSGLLTMDLDKTARPNVAFLRQCGLDISKVACTTLFSTRLFTMNLEVFKETVQRVEELGIDCGARTFRQALAIVALTGKEVVSR